MVASIMDSNGWYGKVIRKSITFEAPYNLQKEQEN